VGLLGRAATTAAVTGRRLALLQPAPRFDARFEPATSTGGHSMSATEISSAVLFSSCVVGGPDLYDALFSDTSTSGTFLTIKPALPHEVQMVAARIVNVLRLMVNILQQNTSVDLLQIMSWLFSGSFI
jgi:hypothetical protein